MSNVLLGRLLASGIVAVVRKVDPDKADALTGAFVRGGVTGIEVTVDSDDAYETIRRLKGKYSDEAVIGAGTVVNKEQAEKALEAGADFIFAPILDRETVEYTKEQGKIMIPGVFTPTEIHQAYVWGADIVKVFPASTLGPGFIKDVNAPLGDIPKMPTGGVNLDNVGEFIKAGSVAAGIGGSLVKKDLIAAGDWDGLENLARQFVNKVQEAR
ncbi:2-dehydro-3-deoxyphosphogluconate aldolase [Alteribacter lacisalsi]|uniref:2-dehydro-3-deoxyphosphogluconate aldolase n=1 Tax=Alteribacter lacisalsi TaxID=2045244 RepID=A0A2W0H2A3_9BACI|nr:bifunctional 4-hydroxy-2-oxoglutarate aldolase/2-dehydro-3-deoxy-phosphogluconate aldolase [Alteribacter lacisalsi]PYZ95914.1 2-dehydro-3-deoxyphosphogluconate aldolase [Alteribacter lacisalsi]